MLFFKNRKAQKLCNSFKKVCICKTIAICKILKYFLLSF